MDTQVLADAEVVAKEAAQVIATEALAAVDGGAVRAQSVGAQNVVGEVAIDRNGTPKVGSRFNSMPGNSVMQMVPANIHQSRQVMIVIKKNLALAGGWDNILLKRKIEIH